MFQRAKQRRRTACSMRKLPDEGFQQASTIKRGSSFLVRRETVRLLVTHHVALFASVFGALANCRATYTCCDRRRQGMGGRTQERSQERKQDTEGRGGVVNGEWEMGQDARATSLGFMAPTEPSNALHAFG
eukprot:CAMPEP_0177626236 /NCGR_PEP_ID=MMETSP0419_2-20121207/30542_1 /TAXON_ID=582737 /ORGANISM="Tetraselmis sp., Strain GSL018" /LENGTH=130 /DNA_ID=CAMNT_0019127269 /DNA_START=130 /DNA_END=518 /DNA_ORIENTATION=+